MPAVNQDITHWRGDSRVITIGPIKDGNGEFVDLTGASARWWMGKNVNATGADIYVQKSDGHGLVIDGDTAGGWSLIITLAPGDTENLTVKLGTFYHEAEVVDGDGDVSTVTTGKFILKPTLIPDAP